VGALDYGEKKNEEAWIQETVAEQVVLGHLEIPEVTFLDQQSPALVEYKQRVRHASARS